MEILKKTLFSLKKIFTQKTSNSELDDEIQFHIEMSIEQKVANGMSREKAELEAKREFGNDLSIRESCRMSWGARFVDELQQDFAYAIRRLFSNKLYSFSIILILASCIAVSIFNYNNLDRNILNPTSIPQASRVVSISHVSHKYGGVPVGYPHICYNQLLDTRNDLFVESGLMSDRDRYAYLNNKTERIRVAEFTPSAWDVFQVNPSSGRFFTETDLKSGNNRLMVIRHEQARKWFGESKKALGKQVKLDNVKHTIVGVLPKNFRLMDNKFDLVIPLSLQTRNYSETPAKIFSDRSTCFARLKKGKTIKQAQSAVETILQQTVEAYPIFKKITEFQEAEHVVTKYTEKSDYRKMDSKTLQFSLTFLSVLLFGMGVINSNALLSVQLSKRKKDSIIRFSLGAKRRRMLQQLGTEVAILYIIGIVLGILFTILFALFSKSNMPSMRSFACCPSVLFVMGLTTSFFVIWLKTKTQKLEQHKEAQTTSSKKSKSLSLLLFVQVGFTAFILLIASILSLNVNRILDADYGFVYQNKFITKITCPSWKFRDDKALTLRTIEEIKQVFLKTPWSREHAIGEALPQTRGTGYSRTGVHENVSTLISPEIAEIYQSISLNECRSDENLMKQMGFRLVKGRWLNQFDAVSPERELVVEERFVEKLSPNREILGRTFHTENQGTFKIVGVIENIEHWSSQYTIDPLENSFYVYEHIFEKRPASRVDAHTTQFAVLTNNPPTIEDALNLQKEIQAVDTDLCVETLSYHNEIMSKNVRLIGARDTALLLAGFTFMIASYGLFCYLLYHFHTLKKELAIRIALGAKFKEILLRFISRQSIPVFLGTTVGAIIAFVAVNKYQDRFTEVTPSDPLPYLCITLLMLILLTLAALLPFYQLKKLPLRDTLTIE